MNEGHALRQLAWEREYQARLAAGDSPDPLIPRVDLESLAGGERYRQVCEMEALDPVTHTVLRGTPLSFLTPSRRLLWQALGQEYIEPDLLDFIDRMSAGATFFDVGASNGLFSLYASATGKKVISFEPEVGNFSLLNHNTYLNRAVLADRQKNFNIALSDQNGLGQIYMKQFEPGGHLKILDSPVERGAKAFLPDYVQTVIKYRLDDFIDFSGVSPPQYMKIDVDGCELEVVRGMERLLAGRDLLGVFIELEEGNDKSIACHRIIGEYGFVAQSHRRVQNYFGENNVVYLRSFES